MSETKRPPALTRRGFLKTTGAAAGVAAAAGAGGALPQLAPAQASASTVTAEGEHTVYTSCRGNCGSKCPTQVVVREGKVVRVSAAELPGDDAPRRRFCVKGYTQPAHLRS